MYKNESSTPLPECLRYRGADQKIFTVYPDQAGRCPGAIIFISEILYKVTLLNVVGNCNENIEVSAWTVKFPLLQVI